MKEIRLTAPGKSFARTGGVARGFSVTLLHAHHDHRIEAVCLNAGTGLAILTVWGCQVCHRHHDRRSNFVPRSWVTSSINEVQANAFADSCLGRGATRIHKQQEKQFHEDNKHKEMQR